MNISIVIIGLFGLIMGSFLNVVIYRLPRRLSLVSPGSHCTSCNTPVRFYDNIPLISYAMLKGRCRECGKKISWYYPTIEMLTAMLLIALFMKYGVSNHFLAYGLLVLFLIPISVIDIERGLILNKLTISGFILGVGLILGLQIESWKEVALGAFGGGLTICSIRLFGKALFKKESMGIGDIKLIIMAGVYIGFPEIDIALFFGVLISAVCIFAGLATKKIEFHDTIPFGPFIALGVVTYLMFGKTIIHWYLGLM